MSGIPEYADNLAERIREALNSSDLDAFGKLLGNNVRWGSDDHPRACRNREDVIATFRRLMNEGAQGNVTELAKGEKGILCRLSITWPAPSEHLMDRKLYHVYLIRDNKIVEIQRFDDRPSASVAAGII